MASSETVDMILALVHRRKLRTAVLTSSAPWPVLTYNSTWTCNPQPSQVSIFSACFCDCSSWQLSSPSDTSSQTGLFQHWLLPFVGIHLRLGCCSNHGGFLCGLLSVTVSLRKVPLLAELTVKLATLISLHAFGLLFRGLKMLPIDLV